jgi:RHS repeat-associated protein
LCVPWVLRLAAGFAGHLPRLVLEDRPVRQCNCGQAQITCLQYRSAPSIVARFATQNSGAAARVGKRLNANGTTDPNGVLNPASTDRGFTGHEHLDELGFVHMNGRIYDPLLGRFLSPDPHIQAEDLLQNDNRYSYVLNNPLRYTDPSGEYFWHAVAFIVGAALASSGNKDLKIIGSIMMMAALGPGVTAEPGLLHLAAGAEKLLPAVVSFASATIANTIAYGPEAGIKAGLFAAAFTGAGGIPGELSPQRIMAHALLGCLQQATSGGQCGPGAAAAAFGKIATGLTGGIESGLAQFAITTVVGGTASVIGGGKFANGAAQAGFGYLFNHLTEAQLKQTFGGIKPPPALGQGDWKFEPDPDNSRGGVWRSTSNRKISASWDKNKAHWDVDGLNTDGTRQRFNRFGQPITAQQAHNYNGPVQRPIDYNQTYNEATREAQKRNQRMTTDQLKARGAAAARMPGRN